MNIYIYGFIHTLTCYIAPTTSVISKNPLIPKKKSLKVPVIFALNKIDLPELHGTSSTNDLCYGNVTAEPMDQQ